MPFLGAEDLPTFSQLFALSWKFSILIKTSDIEKRKNWRQKDLRDGSFNNVNTNEIVFRVTLNFDVPGASSTDKSRSQKRKRNLSSYQGDGCGILLLSLWGNELCQFTMKPKAIFPHPTRCRKNQWGECSPFHINYSSRILALFLVLMYPIDHLGFHIPVPVGIRVTNLHIK